jgi:outer membrane protein OmpA-like peptidoglycan-associated protein
LRAALESGIPESVPRLGLSEMKAVILPLAATFLAATPSPLGAAETFSAEEQRLIDALQAPPPASMRTRGLTRGGGSRPAPESATTLSEPEAEGAAGRTRGVAVVDGASAVLRNVQFHEGKTLLIDESEPVLRMIARVLNSPHCRQARYAIIGHTCDIGTDKDNYRLSRDRAAEIRRRLADLGVAPERLEGLGMGESRFELVAGASLDERRKLARRVEVHRVAESAASTR